MNCIGSLIVEPPGSEGWTQGFFAENFVRGVEVGMEKFGDYSGYRVQNDVYGEATGFVYFVGIGEPYVTHVKIGYTSGDPRKRVKALQTACPFKLKILGFVLGNTDLERELHNVLGDHRAEGEWFTYGDYVQQITDGIIGKEYL